MNNPSPLFWNNRRVLVTGHSGFKGGWLSLWLQMLGAEVCGFSLEPPTKPALFKEANIASGMRSEVGDIRDYASVLRLVRSFQPEVVFHLAAQPLVRQSYIDPSTTYSTNVMGLVNLLEAIRVGGSAHAIINVTSDKCYENKEWLWGYREDEPMGGHDPYSNSKGCAELVTSAYRDSFLQEAGIAIATARAGNVIGGGDWSPDRLVPDILRAFQNAIPVEIRKPEAIRPWQHVLEPLSGYLKLAEKLFENGKEYAGPWNFGPKNEDEQTVESIVSQLAKFWGEGSTWQVIETPQPYEANYLKLDISKARHRLDWAPKWNLNCAIKKTVDWHRAWMKNGNMRKVCQDQIEDYTTTFP